MCYYVEQHSTLKNVVKRFKMPIDVEDNLLVADFISGFSFPNLPIITNEKPELIQTQYSWGLLPTWSKDLDSRKNTLNARMETIYEKASFKNIVTNRCLIIATAFYEWRWMDDKGKTKEKHRISHQEQELFCFAGLYNQGLNPLNGQSMNTFTMLTTQANKLMSYIHNHKMRMPVILNKEEESAWLDPKNCIQDFAYPYESKLIAFELP